MFHKTNIPKGYTYSPSPRRKGVKKALKRIFMIVASVSLLLLGLYASRLPSVSASSTPPVNVSHVPGWSPSITYSGKWFAFETYPQNYIYVGDFVACLSGSSPKVITTNGSHCQVGDYDRNVLDWVLVFARYYPPPSPQADIFVNDSQSNTERQITTTSWTDDWPSIARSEAYSHTVAFTSWIDDGAPQICESSLASPSFTQLTSTGESLWPSRAARLGDMIAHCTIYPGESDHEIAVTNDGAGTVRVTSNSIDDNGVKISDAGDRLVWYDSSNNIWKAFSTGVGISQIAHGWNPEISGDGNWVVFTDDRTGNNEVYITSWIKGEAGGIWNLSNSPADDDQASISSLATDGTYHIVFTSNRASPYEIYGCEFYAPAVVGGLEVSIDKVGLFAPYLGLALAVLIVTVATVVKVVQAYRIRHREDRQ
jgi:hypothetical protein